MAAENNDIIYWNFQLKKISIHSIDEDFKSHWLQFLHNNIMWSSFNNKQKRIIELCTVFFLLIFCDILCESTFLLKTNFFNLNGFLPKDACYI